MIRLAADEDFNNLISRGLRRRLPGLDLLSAQDAGLTRASDDVILEWAALEARVLVTHDARTMLACVYTRVAAGAAMPGAFVLPQALSIGDAIDDLVLVLACSRDDEYRSLVVHFPIK